MAKQLLGMHLVHDCPDGPTSGRIVEVEAYLGPEDRAAHSYNGRRTSRTEVMYHKAGLAYIYRIYGIHRCFNIVSGPEGKPEAILIRALEPVSGKALMAKRRFSKTADQLGKKEQKRLTNGPGKLTVAMGIDMHFYGHDLSHAPLFITEADTGLSDNEICSGPRVNIDYAGDATAYPWRFWLKDHPFVSV